METIITNEHLVRLTEVARKFDSLLEDIEAVSNIQEWCEKRRIKENNPFRTGKCLKNRETGKYKILLAKEITPEMQSSVICAMECRSYCEEINALKNPSVFLTHLLLHEIAHARNENWSEQECDSWAFKELEKISV